MIVGQIEKFKLIQTWYISNCKSNLNNNTHDNQLTGRNISSLNSANHELS